jgi:TonB-dependent SusC/RagA subfamily outer membrane receptor
LFLIIDRKHLIKIETEHVIIGGRKHISPFSEICNIKERSTTIVQRILQIRKYLFKLKAMVNMRIIFIIFFSISIFLNINAQDRSVTGIVTTFDSIPLVGASIKVKSTKQVVLTDSIGNFTILCGANDIIWVQARGFYTQKVKLASSIKLAAINLKIKPGEKNVVYAVGYGKVSERDKLNAIVNLTNDDADFSSYSNIYDLIQGRFAGVKIENGEIIIRGNKSLNASNAALILLNGMQVDNSVLFSIPPGDVKSIDIIKDGGSAVYGSRGANGVVLIETKRRGD